MVAVVLIIVDLVSTVASTKCLLMLLDLDGVTTTTIGLSLLWSVGTDSVVTISFSFSSPSSSWPSFLSLSLLMTS